MLFEMIMQRVLEGTCLGRDWIVSYWGCIGEMEGKWKHLNNYQYPFEGHLR